MNGDRQIAPLQRRARQGAHALLGLVLVALVAATCARALGSPPALWGSSARALAPTQAGGAGSGSSTAAGAPATGVAARAATAGATQARPVTAALAPAAAARAAAMPVPVPLPGVAPPPRISATCAQDVSASMQQWLNTRPPGTIVRAPVGACYLVDEGLKLTAAHDLSIIGGTWEDQAVPAAGAPDTAMNAVFWFVGGSGITLQNLMISGVNPGGYDAAGAFAAGIRSDGVSGLTVTDVFVQHVYGDGINFEPLRASNDLSGTIVRPSEHVVLDNVWIDGAGRQGITLADLSDATLTGVVLANIGIDVFDVEADQWDEGAQNVTIEGCKTKGNAGGLFFANEGLGSGSPWTSNVVVDHCTMTEPLAGDAILIDNGQAQSAPRYAGGQRGPFTFSNDVLRCGNSAYVSCVEVSDGNVTVEDSFLRVPDGTVPEPIYHATNGSTVVFDNDVATGYSATGTTDHSSSASVQGGSWTSSAGTAGGASSGAGSGSASTTTTTSPARGSTATTTTTSATAPGHGTTSTTRPPTTTTTTTTTRRSTTTTTQSLLGLLTGSG